MEQKVSIIIPVYNVEKYLRRCLTSVLEQTYSDLEIILVDDGSPDRCPAICDEYAANDSRVIVIHKPNGGLSSARNAGLDVATGTYICFVDSDDWIRSTSLEYSIRLAETYSADIVETGIYCTSIFPATVSTKERITVYKGKEILQDYMYSTTKGAGYSVCKCLFSKSSIDGIRFREGFNNEDIDFKYKVLSNAQVLVKSSVINYFYYQGTGSITTSGFKKKDFDLDVASDILVDLTNKESFGTIAYLARVKKARCAFSHLCKLALYGCKDEGINSELLIRKLCVENRKNLPLLVFSPIPFSRKVLAVSFAVNYNATKLLLKLMNRPLK